jgi:hypothetical protein
MKTMIMKPYPCWVLILTILFLTSCQNLEPNVLNSDLSSHLEEEGLPTMDPPQSVDDENIEPLYADLSFCDDISTSDYGRLCAIQPSKTDAQIRDFTFNSNIAGPGFGYHVVGVPNDLNNLKGVWLHFGGTYGHPYLPQDGVYKSQVWMNEIVEQGYLVVGIAYDNRQSINGDLCGLQNPGYHVDDCAGRTRREILEGVDHSPVVNVPLQDGVFYRLNKLLAYLNDHGATLPSYFQSGSVDWSRVNVSGHSQGAGHSYFMAKNFGVKSACFLGGPFDNPDSVAPGPTPIADWYTVEGSLTSAQNMGAFVLTTDANYGPFTAAYNLIGLIKNQNWFEASGVYTNANGEPMDGHAASVGAPALKSDRALACFRAQ